jgi:hypothetical protein
MGILDFEPTDGVLENHEATRAMPGTRKKLDEMARRIEEGLPLWHPADCDDCEYGELD